MTSLARERGIAKLTLGGRLFVCPEDDSGKKMPKMVGKASGGAAGT